MKAGRHTAGSAPSLLRHCSCRWGRGPVCTVYVSPGSVGLQVPDCWQTSFAQDNAAPPSLASTVMLSPWLAVTPRHGGILHASLGWRKKKQERSLCLLPLGNCLENPRLA